MSAQNGHVTENSETEWDSLYALNEYQQTHLKSRLDSILKVEDLEIQAIIITRDFFHSVLCRKEIRVLKYQQKQSSTNTWSLSRTNRLWKICLKYNSIENGNGSTLNLKFQGNCERKSQLFVKGRHSKISTLPITYNIISSFFLQWSLDWSSNCDRLFHLLLHQLHAYITRAGVSRRNVPWPLGDRNAQVWSLLQFFSDYFLQ